MLPQAQKSVIELTTQLSHMEAELDAQRTHNQVAMIENEHLRMEVEALRAANVVGVGAQIGYKEADGKFWFLEETRTSERLRA